MLTSQGDRDCLIQIGSLHIAYSEAVLIFLDTKKCLFNHAGALRNSPLFDLSKHGSWGSFEPRSPNFSGSREVFAPPFRIEEREWVSDLPKTLRKFMARLGTESSSPPQEGSGSSL